MVILHGCGVGQAGTIGPDATLALVRQARVVHVIDAIPQSVRKPRTHSATSWQTKIRTRLTSLASMLQVYPLIVEGYAKKRDQISASAAVHQAMRHLKSADTKAGQPKTQVGMPAEFAPAQTERDGTLSMLGKLAKAVLPVDTLLGAEIVDEVVVKATASLIDTSQGRTGIDSDLFKSIASKDEIRARNAAEGFKDRLRRVVALAAIYQWKAKELKERKKGCQLCDIFA